MDRSLGLPVADSEMSLRRCLSMTTLGAHQYEKMDSYTAKLNTIKAKIDDITDHINSNPVTLSSVGELKDDLLKLLSEYKKTSERCLSYLKSHRTADSSAQESFLQIGICCLESGKCHLKT